MTVERLRDVLSAIGSPVTAGELAEVLWLACHITAKESEAETTLRPGNGNYPDWPTEAPPPGSVEERHELARAERAVVGPGDRELYAEAASVPGPGASTVLVPTAPMLHEVLAVQRALRPLKRRVASSRSDLLDEDATAARIADQPRHRRPWVPVMRASSERWLSLAFVIDTGPSMRIWRPLARELQEVLTQLGAFHHLRVWYLRGEAVSPSPAATPLSPAALVDPSGRQVVLVLSDCSGAHWWDGRAGRALHVWAQHGPAAVLQPLPERLWRRTAASPIPGLALAQRPGASNAELTFNPYDTDPGQDIPVPVMEISPSWLADWARLITGQSAEGLPTAATYVSSRPPSQAEPLRRERELPVGERVQRFRATATPEAARLAAHVAVSVPSLPVMRLIQHRLLRSQQPSHLAEVLLSGLLRPVNADRGIYEFIPGSREALLATLPRSESWHAADVLDRVSAEIEARAGSVAETFTAYLGVPRGATDHTLGQDRPFALVSPEALRLLSHTAIDSSIKVLEYPGDEVRLGDAVPEAGADAIRTLVDTLSRDLSERTEREEPAGSAAEAEAEEAIQNREPLASFEPLPIEEVTNLVMLRTKVVNLLSELAVPPPPGGLGHVSATIDTLLGRGVLDYEQAQALRSALVIADQAARGAMVPRRVAIAVENSGPAILDQLALLRTVAAARFEDYVLDMLRERAPAEWSIDIDRAIVSDEQRDETAFGVPSTTRPRHARVDALVTVGDRRTVVEVRARLQPGVPSQIEAVREWTKALPSDLPVLLIMLGEGLAPRELQRIRDGHQGPVELLQWDRDAESLIRVVRALLTTA